MPFVKWKEADWSCNLKFLGGIRLAIAGLFFSVYQTVLDINNLIGWGGCNLASSSLTICNLRKLNTRIQLMDHLRISFGSIFTIYIYTVLLTTSET